MAARRADARPRRDPAPPLGAWGFVVRFGIVSLLADFVYEGARSITGPLLGSLGASGFVVGVVTGAGEAAALVLRLVSGPLTDRTRRFWAWTISGYVLTVVSVPLLGVAGVLWVAAALVIAERVGKAVRSPAKDTLLSHATTVTGRGRGFAVHEALDQVGAVAGPLTVAAVLAATGDDFTPALTILAIPGAATLLLLVRIRIRVPDPARYEPGAAPRPGISRVPLPRRFWLYCLFTAVSMLGATTYGVLSLHMVAAGVFTAATVPVVYAGATGADAVAALASGWLYDRVGAKTLLVLPVSTALVPVLGFAGGRGAVLAGALLWGATVGVQESTLRAVVADLVPADRRATAYGIYAAVLGTATAAGGAITGFLSDASYSALVATVVVVECAAVVVLSALAARRRPAAGR
ncbi:MFS transporter [Nocardia nova]|uniref:MFS transporter n=1 Tax=Nocardia nova TaxID=37330 RepID=A0A2S6AUI4_9NOCA|nr:MFS transporter [Nocardia nova]PPJ30982.1 MFS transporter [Nocardia nova]PPJ38942.1 MFS transporter [Nocardia nova]